MKSKRVSETNGSPKKKTKTTVIEDPFDCHFNYELPEDFQLLAKGNLTINVCIKSSILFILGSNREKLQKIKYDSFEEGLTAKFTPMAEFAMTPLKNPSGDCLKHIVKPLRKNCKGRLGSSPFLQDFYSILESYKDVYYPVRKFESAEDIRHSYCLHVLNHIMKTRSAILDHNAKLQVIYLQSNCSCSALVALIFVLGIQWNK